MSVEPAEIEELRGRVLGIIGAYGMGDSVDPRKLYLKTAPATPPPPVPVPVGGTSATGSSQMTHRIRSQHRQQGTLSRRGDPPDGGCPERDAPPEE